MEAADAEKLRRKELHRKSMILTGALTAGSALAAAWLGFAPSAFVPRLRLGPEGPRPDLEAALKPSVVRWEPFSAEALSRARKLDRLVLLSLAARWSSASRIMDGTAYADDSVARLAQRSLVAVRVDADERPDLALRYLGRGWPTTALLLPSGQILADGTYMSAPVLRAWVETICAKYRQRRAGVIEAAQRAEREAPGAASAGDPRRALEATWSGPAVFPRFDRLLSLSRLRADWARALERRGARAALALQDADGGFWRDRGGPQPADEEKRLGDQAGALAYLSKAEPAAAARLRAFVASSLALPGGGYRSAVWRGGRDERWFCDESARMAAAVLSDPASAQSERAHARRTVERLWAARAQGLAARGPGGPAGLLGDQLGLLEALLAAGRAADAGALELALERRLLSDGGDAFFDRLPAGELSRPLDRIIFAGLNARARRDLLALARALGPRESRAAAVRALALKLERRLRERPEGLDAGDAAELQEGER